MKDEEFRQASRNVWDAMATGWDSNRDYMWETSRPVGEWLVEKLEPSAGQTVLEVAAGMGDTGFIAAQLLGENGRLISTDFSSAMIDGARRRAAEIGITNAEFRTMDAEKMDLDGSSVDGMLCRWGYMLMGDPGTAFAEACRVLKPGGRLCLSVFAAAEKNPWAALPAKAMIHAGLMEPPAPGTPGILALADQERLSGLLNEAGFTDLVLEEVPLTWRHDDFDSYWQFLTEVAGAIATIIESLPADRQAVARDAIAAAIEPFHGDAGVALPGVTLNVVAHAT
jgi:ubiquinone/menaquinone biosynthesis C-methylase UbiE